MPDWYDYNRGCPYSPYCHTYTDISAGWWHTCATARHMCLGYGDPSDNVHCWGSNDDGRLFGGPSFYLNVALMKTHSVLLMPAPVTPVRS